MCPPFTELVYNLLLLKIMLLYCSHSIFYNWDFFLWRVFRSRITGCSQAPTICKALNFYGGNSLSRRGILTIRDQKWIPYLHVQHLVLQLHTTVSSDSLLEHAAGQPLCMQYSSPSSVNKWIPVPEPRVCCAYSLSCVWLFVIPWTVAHPDPLSMAIFQERILEWVAMPSSRGSSQSRDWTQVSSIVGGFFTIWATREAWATN